MDGGHNSGVFCCGLYGLIVLCVMYSAVDYVLCVLIVFHCCLLEGEPQPLCASCNEAPTDHLVKNCAEFADIKWKHYSANTV